MLLFDDQMYILSIMTDKVYLRLGGKNTENGLRKPSRSDNLDGGMHCIYSMAIKLINKSDVTFHGNETHEVVLGTEGYEEELHIGPLTYSLVVLVVIVADPEEQHQKLQEVSQHFIQDIN